jgi:heme oxygenase
VISPDGLLAGLRARTANLHREVERVQPLARLVEERLSLDGYLVILGRFWRFHVSQEAALDAALAPEFSSRPNVALLERDLRGITLDLPPPEPRLTPAESVGALYVLEGSALGGVVIGRRLRDFPELGDRVAFFSRSAHEVAGRWRGFCSLLDSLDRSLGAGREGLREAAVAGACRAFEAARRVLGGDEWTT